MVGVNPQRFLSDLHELRAFGFSSVGVPRCAVAEGQYRLPRRRKSV